MARFWLATFAFEQSMASEASAAEPLATADARAWAVEVIHDEVLDENNETRDEYAMLLSTADSADNPEKLVCRIGFANSCKSCSVWHDRGFPLIDAIIKRKDSNLSACSPCFLVPPAMDYAAELISIANILLNNRSPGTITSKLNASYEQKLKLPDVAYPATRIEAKTVTWSPTRSSVNEFRNIQLKFGMARSRYPSLVPFKEGAVKPVKFWSGIVELPKPNWPRVLTKAPVERTGRVETFGVAAFRFENLEMLGFRIDLARLGRDDDEGLAALVEPLNFHIDQQRISSSTITAMSDFRYRPATRTLMLELLRYDKMKLRTTSPPLTRHDFQSQHELLLRILVGRVDDDTAQARDPATFVPTIFVDNPWSKALGRSTLGYDKRRADFCVVEDGRPIPLRPDGRLSADDKKPQPLASVEQIHLATHTTGQPSGYPLVELDCPYQTIDDWDAFEKINLQLAMGPVSIPQLRWRQSDFDAAEFRRSFAHSVVSKTLKGFRSVQVSPVGGNLLRDALRAETTWITGTFTFDDDVLFAQPTGTVTLTFHAKPSAPPVWKALCKLLGIDKHGSISLPAGSWYRMRCSMDLKIDDGLD
jgi:hypothetical protein